MTYSPFEVLTHFGIYPTQRRCQLLDLQQLLKEEKSQSPPRCKASDSGSAPTTAVSKSRQPNVKQSNAPRGWQESSGSIVHNRYSMAQANNQGLSTKNQNGPDTAGLRGRGRSVRGQGSRGGSKTRQQSARPGRLEAPNRLVEGGQQQEQEQKRAENVRPDETSSSVPQKCAEEKEAQSANSSNLRKSPRSKEVRFCPSFVSPSIRCCGIS